MSAPAAYGLRALLASHPPAACCLFVTKGLPFIEAPGSIRRCYSLKARCMSIFFRSKQIMRTRAHKSRRRTGGQASSLTGIGGSRHACGRLCFYRLLIHLLHGSLHLIVNHLWCIMPYLFFMHDCVVN